MEDAQIEHIRRQESCTAQSWWEKKIKNVETELTEIYEKKLRIR